MKLKFLSQKKILFLLIFFCLITLVLVINTIQQKQSASSRAFNNPARLAWLNHYPVYAKNSFWLKKHQYSDCPDTNTGLWPSSLLDCLIPEAEPVKHLSPTAIISDLPNLAVKIFNSWSSGFANQNDLSNHLKTLFQNLLNPTASPLAAADSNLLTQIADLLKTYSFSSLLLEINSDNQVVSAALMIHPQIELIITDVIGTQARSDIIFKPFIQSVTGLTDQQISSEDVHQLYYAGLYQCGKNADPGQPSKAGLTKQFHNFTATVQALDLGDGSGDCNILITQTTQ